MKQQLSLALFVCDTPRPQVLDKYGDYPTMFAEIFSKAASGRNVDITWQFFDVVHKQEYPDLRDLAENKTFDGIVISGSAASAYTDEPWILKLVEFVHFMRAEPYRHQVRLVGFCFGHQIIARASGGHCEKNPNGWEFGLVDIFLTPLGKEVLHTEKALVRIHQVHQDHVRDLPPGFHSLATTAPHTPIHSLISDDNQCITIQGHPEFKRDVVRILLTLRRDAGIVPTDYANKQLERLDKEQEDDEDDQWLVGKMIDFLQGNLTWKNVDTVDAMTGMACGPNVKIGND
ncbi:class I glutamine amidotransferase-like protein [Dichotomocladium elegans]|nr:class I glutamine amidotransferase-like protein [Dichotomocladium elegans]